MAIWTAAVFSSAGPRNGASCTRRCRRCTFLPHVLSSHLEQQHWSLFWYTYLIVRVKRAHAVSTQVLRVLPLFTRVSCLARHSGGKLGIQQDETDIFQRGPRDVSLRAWIPEHVDAKFPPSVCTRACVHD